MRLRAEHEAVARAETKPPLAHLSQDSLDEIVNWCKANPSEMVIMHLWDCGSDGSGDCNALVQGVLDGRNLKGEGLTSWIASVSVGC